jgi:hypothetical protein
MDKEIAKNSNYSEINLFQKQLETAKQYVNVIKNSLYGKLFEVRVPDENSEKDENGLPTKTKVVIRDEDIISCILLGRELGLSDMVSITFGKALDRIAYFKVMKGRSLGLDAITSLSRIFAYEDRDGKMIIGTDAAAINASVTKVGITFEIIEDFKSKKYYRDSKTKVFLGYDFDDDWVVVNRGATQKAKDGIAEGKFPVLEDITQYSKAVFHRKNWSDHTETYSLLEATEAGLYKGFKFDGTEEKGKFAWNANPKRILTTRLIAIGQSRIAGDVLNGTYTTDEVLEIKSNDLNKDITNAEIIEDNK